MSLASDSPPENPTPPLTTKKPQPVPWTQQETVNLIQAYQDIWYSLRRGPLKSNQWEEVALNVSLLCGYDHHYPTKTAIQCRHKMEKLRKRYREEKRRLSSGSGSCFWPYYYLMDSLERGPLPLSARPIGVGVPLVTDFPSNHRYLQNPNHFNTAVASHNNIYDEGFNSNSAFNVKDSGFNNYEEDEDEEEEKEEEEEDSYSGYRGKSRSINYILKKPSPPVVVVAREGEGVRGLNVGAKKRKRDEGEEVAGLGCLAGEIRGLVERMVQVEREKMEMARETERWRMEMEVKRTEMILDSQRKIVELIDEAFGSGSGQWELKAEREV